MSTLAQHLEEAATPEEKGPPEALCRKLRVEASTLMPDLIVQADWDRERLRAHREQALRTLLRRAIDGSVWHRERLHGVDPETFAL